MLAVVGEALVYRLNVKMTLATTASFFLSQRCLLAAVVLLQAKSVLCPLSHWFSISSKQRQQIYIQAGITGDDACILNRYI